MFGPAHGTAPYSKYVPERLFQLHFKFLHTPRSIFIDNKSDMANVEWDVIDILSYQNYLLTDRMSHA